MVCDLNDQNLKSCTLIARHGDIEVDKLVIVNKIVTGGGSTVDQQARDDIATLKHDLNETQSNVNSLGGQVQDIGNSTINNLVLETTNVPENQTGNQSGGGNGGNTGNETGNQSGNGTGGGNTTIPTNFQEQYNNYILKIGTRGR